MENTILYAGIKELNEIKGRVIELAEYRKKSDELQKEETRLSKLLSSREKDMDIETESTLKKRKSELASAYESQLSSLNSKNKKAKSQKEKAKEGKVSERIDEETAELKGKNKELMLEMKARLKADKTPRFCNTTLFYAFFMPKTAGEILVFILGLLIVFLAIPFGIYLAFFAQKFSELALAVIYIVMILVVGSIYLAINNNMKEKHLDTIRAVRGLRNQYRRNKKNISDIRKGIKNDRDESAYGLEQYDEELQKISEEIQKITEEERKALSTFETVTAQQIKSEIESRYEGELVSLKEKYKETAEERKQVEKKEKELSLMLSREYEAYLGKDMLTVQKIDKLISYIEKGEAADIGEALAVERNRCAK